MAVKKGTSASEINIRVIHPLTEEMLARRVALGITLKSFLREQCTVLAHGTSTLYSTLNCAYTAQLKENRAINEAHCLSLMESYRKDGYLFTIVYLNEKLEIIDGQHRLEAAKRMNLPVNFMIMPGWGIKEVTILNMNSRTWTITDFMEMHAKAGNPNYIRFKEFYDTNEFDLTVCQLLVTGRRSGGYASSDDFRLGLMQVDEQHLTEAYLKVKKIEELKQFHPNGWKSRNFVNAMTVFFATKGYSHEHLVAKLTVHPEIVLLQARSLRVEEYLNLFLEKYNFRRMKDKLEIPRR